MQLSIHLTKDQMKKDKPKYRTLNYVPYQLCPRCNGEGKIEDKLSSSCFSVCDICLGAKIIPMHVVENTYIMPGFEPIIQLYEVTK